jgi:hypothetical protein
MDPRAPTPRGIDWTKLRKEVTDSDRFLVASSDG